MFVQVLAIVSNSVHYSNHAKLIPAFIQMEATDPYLTQPLLLFQCLFR